MKSVIVSKFYSRLEKLGLNKHKVSESEVKFLDSLSNKEQVEALNDEIDFKINRLNIKMHLCMIIILIIIFLSIYTIFWILVSIVIPAIIFNRYRTFVKIQKMVKKMVSEY